MKRTGYVSLWVFGGNRDVPDEEKVDCPLEAYLIKAVHAKEGIRFTWLETQPYIGQVHRG